MRPLIGLTQCLDSAGRWRRGRVYQYLDHAYAQAVDSAGGTAIALPIGRDVAGLVDRLDALILPGGDDFLPPPGGPAYPDDVVFAAAPPEQLDFDRRVLERALERGLPVLGICYGAQLLALQRGGTLYHHLPIDRPEGASHQLDEDTGRHALIAEPGSRLAGILGHTPIDVNSLHHQAIAHPGEGMAVSGRAPDGLIEAIEARDGRFLLGVQWHPEKQPDPGGPALFRALVAACTEG